MKTFWPNFDRLVPKTLILLCLSSVNICTVSVQADDKIDSRVSLQDDSDKWLSFPRFSTKPQERRVYNSNFQILGITLEQLKDEDGDFKNLLQS